MSKTAYKYGNKLVTVNGRMAQESIPAPAIIGEQFYIQFPAYYKNYIDVTIDASSAGTYVDEVLTNVASVIYTVNTVPVTIPFSVVNGDILGIIITKTDCDCLALVELTNESIAPYMFNSGGYTSVYPPAHNDTYVKATSNVAGFEPYLATDPSKSLIGNWIGNQWISSGGNVTNQRFHIDLGGAHTIGRIYYENSHNSGVYINCGAMDITVWGSNSASDFADLTYANDGTWTQVTSVPTLMSPHIGKNQTDPRYIILNNTSAYRYWAIKIANAIAPAPELNVMGIRRIELQV